MLQKLINFFKGITRKNKPTYIPFKLYTSDILRQSQVFNYYDFIDLPLITKITTYKEMYYNSSIIFSATEFLVTTINSLPYYYYHPDNKVKEKINDILNKIRINDFMYEITKDIIIKGFALYVIYNNNGLKLENIETYEEVTTNTIKISSKHYPLSDFIFINKQPSSFLTLIPLYNIIKALEDSIYKNIIRFGIPYTTIKSKINLSEEEINKIAEDLKNFYSNHINIPFIAYDSNVIDFEIKTPENIINDYINLYTMIEKIIYKVLGILPTISGDIGGSYAKAKIQENQLLRKARSILSLILEELNTKLLPKIFVYNNLEDYVINNNYGYFSITEEFKEKLEVDEKLQTEKI
ncbi:MAG: hypothetical protein QXR71_04580 [Candidatus Aenigmatarchaeota archaeon]